MDQDSGTERVASPGGTAASAPAPVESASSDARLESGWAPATEPVTAGPVTPVRGRGTAGARWVNAALIGAVVLAVAGVAFAVGRMSAPAAAAAGGGNGGQGFPGFGGGNRGYFRNGGDGGNGFPGGGNGPFGAAGGGITVEGTVESVSADTLTVKTASGQTIQVSLGTDTTYHAQSSATASDVKTGGTVIVRLGLRRQAEGATGPAASDVTVVP